MNKKLIQAFQNRGLVIIDTNAFGKINGYEVNFAVMSREFNKQFMFQISFYASQAEKQLIIYELKKENIFGLEYFESPYGIMGGMGTILTYGSVAKVINTKFDRILEIIDKHDVKKSEYCPVCGNELSEGSFKECRIQGFHVNIDLECVEHINKEIEEDNKRFNEQPNNFLKGFLGALLGAAIASVITIVLYFLGFVSALPAVVGAYLGCNFYQKFGGKPNYIMIIITTVTTIVLTVLTVVGIYVYAANGIDNLKLAFKYTEGLKGEFIFNIILTFVFSLIGGISSAYTMSRKIKRGGKLD